LRQVRADLGHVRLHGAAAHQADSRSADPIILRKVNGLPRWQRRLFGFLHRLSKPLAEELRIKPERRVELGLEVDV
jgi:K+ transporter